LVSITNGKVSTLADFGYLSQELASISPSIATSKSVTAKSVSCPASTGTDWKANTQLPPTPNQGVCNCANNAAKCVVADNVASKNYGKLFSYLCGQVSCDGISGNGTSGDYGAFSFCAAKEQLNFVLNAYYEKNGADDSACDFSGSASINKGASTAKACSAVMNQAGTAGTGFVSASVSGSFTGGAEALATGSGGSGAGSTGSGSGSSSSGSATTSSKKNGATTINSGLVIAGSALSSILVVMALVM